MLPWLANLILIGTAYWPLAALLGLRWWFRDQGMGLVFGVVAGILLLVSFAIYAAIRGRNSGNVVIVSAEPMRESVVGFLLTCLLPFLLIDIGDSLLVAASGLFVALIGVVSFRMNLIYLNPAFVLFGGLRAWGASVYKEGGDATKAYAAVVMTNRVSLRPNDAVSISELGTDTLIERKN